MINQPKKQGKVNKLLLITNSYVYYKKSNNFLVSNNAKIAKISQIMGCIKGQR
ncbi:hypothetical protein AO368_0043 [Moraxella catarrhalis]|uniref:Uncharacterized protein n=1 Tax=Moraxella catarrhalis TaxID=480 RepID=A0A7Z1A461_MORCA|nr:hypothetical protein AO382_1085 [Moraxella catarrhalis]OAV33498.1 hypothetical protein AO368_0043 [Moraxella catarrhalis]RUO14556.1 hypothetical protein EJK49_1698 [Moraxella catarrhalis]